MVFLQETQEIIWKMQHLGVRLRGFSYSGGKLCIGHIFFLSALPFCLLYRCWCCIQGVGGCSRSVQKG